MLTLVRARQELRPGYRGIDTRRIDDINRYSSESFFFLLQALTTVAAGLKLSDRLIFGTLNGVEMAGFAETFNVYEGLPRLVVLVGRFTFFSVCVCAVSRFHFLGVALSLRQFVLWTLYGINPTAGSIPLAWTKGVLFLFSGGGGGSRGFLEGFQHCNEALVVSPSGSLCFCRFVFLINNFTRLVPCFHSLC